MLHFYTSVHVIGAAFSASKCCNLPLNRRELTKAPSFWQERPLEFKQFNKRLFGGRTRWSISLIARFFVSPVVCFQQIGREAQGFFISPRRTCKIWGWSMEAHESQNTRSEYWNWWYILIQNASFFTLGRRCCWTQSVAPYFLVESRERQEYQKKSGQNDRLLAKRVIQKNNL